MGRTQTAEKKWEKPKGRFCEGRSAEFCSNFSYLQVFLFGVGFFLFVSLFWLVGWWFVFFFGGFDAVCGNNCVHWAWQALVLAAEILLS